MTGQGEGVYLVDGDHLSPVAVRGNLEGEDVSLTLRLGEGLTGHVAETGKSMLISNASESDVGDVSVGPR